MPLARVQVTCQLIFDYPFIWLEGISWYYSIQESSLMSTVQIIQFRYYKVNLFTIFDELVSYNSTHSFDNLPLCKRLIEAFKMKCQLKYKIL